MDDRWESEIIEFGAINITGFRIVDTNRRLVREFYDSWKRLDPQMSVGAGRESISVSSHSHSRYPVRTRPAHTYLTVKYLRGFNVWPERERERE